MDEIEKRINDITEELKKLLEKKVLSNQIKGVDAPMKYNNKKIVLRSDGRWFARYYNKFGKQVSVYGKTQEECIKKLKVALKNKDAEQEKSCSKNITLENWITQWIDLFKVGKIRQSTMYDLNCRLKRYVLSQPIAKMKLKEITAIDLQELLNSIEAPRQKEHIYTYLKDMFNKALKLNLIKSDLFVIINLPKREKRKGHAFTKKQEQDFVKACNNSALSDIGDYYLLMLYSGLRKGEARALTLNDVDFENKTISITKSLSKANEIGLPKNGCRTIPLFKQVEEILQKYKNKPKDKRIFEIGATKAQAHFRMIADRINLEEATIHDLRHTFCTRCMELGIPVEQTKEWAGHSDIKITQEYYVHINSEFEQKNVAIKNGVRP